MLSHSFKCKQLLKTLTACTKCMHIRMAGAFGKTSKNEAKVGFNRIKKREEEPFLYINNEMPAKMILKRISDDLAKEKSVIFDASPGEGFSTRMLLDSGAPKVCVFADPKNHQNLLRLKVEYSLIDAMILLNTNHFLFVVTET